jgi:hypothetical protein
MVRAGETTTEGGPAKARAMAGRETPSAAAPWNLYRERGVREVKKAAAFAALLAALLVGSAQAQDPNPCSGGVDETASIQAAVDAGTPVNFAPRLHCINARLGIRIPSDRELRLNGATIGILPGCVTNCKAMETIPGSQNVRLVGPGLVLGDLTPAVGFSIGFRGDSVTGLELERVHFRNWRTDGIWLGGNLGTHTYRLDKVLVEDFGRNGLSIVNGSLGVVQRYECRRSNPGANPGACIDVEPNPGDRVTHLTIMDSLVEDAVVGYYLHAGRGFQGYGIKLLNSIARNCSRYGVILNSTAHAFILDNQVFAPAAQSGQPIPVGISVGATAAITADDVTISGNRVEGTTRSAILAGVKDTRVIGNAWIGGSMATVQPSATVPATAGIQFWVP